jgi:hypothetical protein
MKDLGARTKIYANMLTLQADMAFPFERPFYENSQWQYSKTICDFGCGNAYYICKLAVLYPEKKIYGVEIDDEMRNIAIENTVCFDNVEILKSINELEHNRIDFFIFRLVMLHLPERKIAYECVKRFANRNASVLVIDADDEYFLCNPIPTKFMEALFSLRSKSVNRNLLEIINKEVGEYGLSPIFSMRIIINNVFPHASETMFKYMYYTAELSIGSPLPDEIRNDLLEWWLYPNTYVQYGIFGKLFTIK